MDVHPFDRHADLAAGQESALDEPSDVLLVEYGVVEDDRGVVVERHDDRDHARGEPMDVRGQRRAVEASYLVEGVGQVDRRPGACDEDPHLHLALEGDLAVLPRHQGRPLGLTAVEEGERLADDLRSPACGRRRPARERRVRGGYRRPGLLDGGGLPA
ncbi:hypothetical protein P1S61_22065 [Streptomyces sp. ME08-AFT2]|nr:hypothetical protein [Streptomyces sp. ME08-AFT2]MDX3311697.1 hypothetical protein [Streptomyces sp. ME08-AFT2]